MPDIETIQQIRARFPNRALTREELPLVRWIIERNVNTHTFKGAFLRLAAYVTTTGGAIMIAKAVIEWLK